MEKEKKINWKETVSFILYIVVVFVITYLVITYVGQRTEVIGTSMEYTLSDGDNLIVDKISYRFRDPQRFDIIVFHISTRKTLIISSELSVCRERQYRLMRMEPSILMGKNWKNPMGEKS